MKINEIKEQIFKNFSNVEDRLHLLSEDRQISTSGEIWYN